MAGKESSMTARVTVNLRGLLGSDAKEPEILIAIIGVTGAGKTTFVSRVTGDTSFKIGHDIDSLTSSTFTLDSTRVRLLDTPGFDDSHRSEV
ncbi:hypothetical protein B0T18DRAFT_430014 [Schizothecium vesticola]|uniref:G domain-containing protein n=1 Tax=Schizothecium vesticola TaxID=314040 RepID=A0AA40K6H6_9PEZI|nr:hypothetical protein B0T18DRAFT_430014 [Schizothecium vesticola]